MRAYRATDEEALRARSLLKDWTGQGFLTKEQYQRMDQETPCDLRRTNIFLRIVLFFFTVIIVAAAVALFLTTFVRGMSIEKTGPYFLVFAAISYAGAEFAVSRARFYRHGVEEALVACSVVFLCVGLASLLANGRTYSPTPHIEDLIVPTAGALLSVWIWHRFELAYAFLAAMLFVPWIPGYWTSSHPAEHLTIAAVYSFALIAVMVVRAPSRFTYLNENFSISEALLWLGTYFTINLQISLSDLTINRFGFDRIGAGAAAFPRPFYWTTWVLTWLLPPAILTRGIRTKDRWIIAAGLATTILTFITNKPYLGWPRHTWDPMLLGALLIAVALYIRHWLSRSTNGIRRGFTAQRLSAKDKTWMQIGNTALGLVAPEQIPHPQPTEPEFRFGGGDSGGGGASSDF